MFVNERSYILRKKLNDLKSLNYSVFDDWNGTFSIAEDDSRIFKFDCIDCIKYCILIESKYPFQFEILK